MGARRHLCLLLLLIVGGTGSTVVEHAQDSSLDGLRSALARARTHRAANRDGKNPS